MEPESFNDPMNYLFDMDSYYQMLNDPEPPSADLADVFGVSPTTISTTDGQQPKWPQDPEQPNQESQPTDAAVAPTAAAAAAALPSGGRIDNYMMKIPNKVLNKKVKKAYTQLKVHQTQYFIMLLCILEKEGLLQQGFDEFKKRAQIEWENAKEGKKDNVKRYLDNAQSAYVTYINQDYETAMDIIFWKQTGKVKNIQNLQDAKQRMFSFRKKLGLSN